MEHSTSRQIPWQPACSAISMATLCSDLGDSLPCSVSLLVAVRFGAWRCWRTNSRRTAASNLAAKPSKDAREPPSTPQSTGHIGVLRTMENFDDLPWNFSLRRPAWRCFDFATVLAKFGIDQLLTYASLCWRTRRLSLLSPPLLYAHAER